MITAPDQPTPEDVARLTTDEVLALTRISRATLWRRVASGRLPGPIDQGRQSLFLKSAVLSALRREAGQSLTRTVAVEQRLEAMRRRRHRHA